VRALLASCGGGVLREVDCASVWPEERLVFRRTLGTWGRVGTHPGQQTSRNGVNLVVRLDFTRSHDRLYAQLYGSRRKLNHDGHPISRDGNTMAWARLDVDLDAGEVLIEEIQNDWLRCASARVPWTKRQAHSAPDRRLWSSGPRACDALSYLTDVLAPYRRVWDEAMLAVTLAFIRDDLGCSRVWYHQYDSGIKAKRMEPDWGPPRSLYTRLPRRFCFQPSEEPPGFIKRLRARRLQGLSWFRLEL